jgi:hypothetical protein
MVQEQWFASASLPYQQLFSSSRLFALEHSGLTCVDDHGHCKASAEELLVGHGSCMLPCSFRYSCKSHSGVQACWFVFVSLCCSGRRSNPRSVHAHARPRNTSCEQPSAQVNGRCSSVMCVRKGCAKRSPRGSASNKQA